MIKYTTPTITLRVKGEDITGADVYVSIEQGATKLTKKNDFTITSDGTNTSALYSRHTSRTATSI